MNPSITSKMKDVLLVWRGQGLTNAEFLDITYKTATQYGISESMLYKLKQIISDTEVDFEQFLNSNVDYKLDYDVGAFVNWNNKSDGFIYSEREIKKKIEVVNQDEELGKELAERMRFFNYKVKELLKGANKRLLAFQITANDLNDLYNKQEGKCCFSGNALPLFILDSYDKGDSLSVDRIDNGEGYVEGNLQLCSNIYNIMKSNMNNDEFKRVLIKAGNYLQLQNEDEIQINNVPLKNK